MATNEILPFGTITNDKLHADVAALNTNWRQSSFVTSVLAQFVANNSGKDVLDDGDTATLLINLQEALKQYANGNLPAASTTVAGVTKLSSATNSNDEMVAATPKSVKSAYDLASGKYSAQDATTAQKGIVQLSSATDSTSETMAATPNAVKSVGDRVSALSDRVSALSVDIDNAKSPDANGNSISVDVSYLYPLGIVIWFESSDKDPNLLFPGTTWKHYGRTEYEEKYGFYEHDHGISHCWYRAA
jgi:hypothetical protein